MQSLDFVALFFVVIVYCIGLIQNGQYYRFVIKFVVYRLRIIMDVQKLAQDTFNNLHKSVVLVICKVPNGPSYSTGSGFIIGKTQRGSYLVMTCFHVIRGPDPSVVPIIRVRIPNDDKDTEEYEAFIVKGTKKDDADEREFASRESDLALIEVHGVTREYQPLEFCDSEAVKDVRPETCVFVLGYILQPDRPGTPRHVNLEPSVSPGAIR